MYVCVCIYICMFWPNPDCCCFAAMSLTCHIAFCETDAHQLGLDDSDSQTVILPELFEMRSIPLKMSPQEAMQAALCVHTQQAMKAAVAETEWWVLAVTWDAEARVKLYDDKTLKHATDRIGTGCFRMYGPLRLSEATRYTVRTMFMPQTSLLTWAKYFLKNVLAKFNGVCASCDNRGLVGGRTTSDYRVQDWCLECWHNFCMSVSPADLHAAAVIRGQRS
jgi:hypothetical protein